MTTSTSTSTPESGSPPSPTTKSSGVSVFIAVQEGRATLAAAAGDAPLGLARLRAILSSSRCATERSRHGVFG